MAEVIRHTIEANGAELAVYEAGAGEPVFVFVHGLACDHTAWQPQFDDLARDHRCIAIDQRGRGSSEAAGPYHVEQQADDVAAVMRALGIGRAVIIGHSLGGIAALVLNERHPDLVMGIAIGDSPVRSKGGGGRLIARLEAEGEAGMKPLVESFFWDGTSEDTRAAVRAMMACPPEVAGGMLADLDALGERMTELLKLADQKPLMALWAGTRDRADMTWLREVCMYIRQEPVPGTGHFFQLEKPAVTNALLRAFLDDVERDPRIAH